MLDLAYGQVDLGGVNVDAQALTSADAAAVRTIHHKRNISVVAPRLIGTIDMDGARVLLVGIVVREERGVKSWWRLTGRYPDADAEVLLGAEAAKALVKGPGDRLSLGGCDRLVTGVLQPTGTLDDRAVFTELATVQDLLRRPNGVTLIEVSALCRGCPIEDIVAQIAGVLPHARVTPIRQAVAAREQAVAQMTRFAMLVSVVVLLAGVLVIVTTMLSSVSERTQEIGILRAVGFRQSHVVRVILIEVLALSVLGGVVGWFGGFLGARVFARSVGNVAGAVPPDAALAAAAVGLAVVMGTASGAYPALRAARMDPSQAFRQL
jgi:putative ABC transport system permease protein